LGDGEKALIPAPFLFQRYIARVLTIFGIQALGPVQLGGQRTPMLRGPLFSSLDEYLALSTKALLIWLADQPDVATAEEILSWTAIETNPGETRSEIAASLATGCMRVDRKKYQVTNLGKRYVAHCLEGQRPHNPDRL